ncbi:hypothetical protein QR685DRAFT_597581 [Neurospora intermedia]|uniref:Uncharacterized protein n=1 Tax=Neurospora intermedia TaxID=5142 RepID=A0ABR3DEF3_NEUIN
MASAAHPLSHELDGDSTWRTGDKPELHGESLLTAAATTPVKELSAQYSEPKELDSSVKPVELPVELPAEANVTDGFRDTNQAVMRKAQLKFARLSCKLTAVEPIAELRFATCQTLPESSFKAGKFTRDGSRRKAKTAAHLWLEFKDKSALIMMG